MVDANDSFTVLPDQATPLPSPSSGAVWFLSEKARRIGCLASEIETPSAAAVVSVSAEAVSATVSVPGRPPDSEAACPRSTCPGYWKVSILMVYPISSISRLVLVTPRDDPK